MKRIDGYRGIWFTLGQFSEYGDKYSGGLGTYTSNHVPMAVYVEKVRKTFFVYGGTTAANERHLLCMVGVYDHDTGTVSKPVVVYDKRDVDDPHDNPCINVDADGHLYVIVSGRGSHRPGFKFRSVEAHDVSAFDLVEERELTYPQLHAMPDGSWFLLFTKYSGARGARELYWQTSRDGRAWTAERKLVGMGGHYQVSSVTKSGLIGTTFMDHPDGDVDRRTDLYYAQTLDGGTTWTTADGRPLTLPVTDPAGAARVIDYRSQRRNVYIHDLNFDPAGRPAILYTTSKGATPGPASGPYEWRVTRWNGRSWQTVIVAESDHCYDAGSLVIEGDAWQIIGPTGTGPQPWAAGGEMSLWTSADAGVTWNHARQITHDSAANHSYARRPLHAHDDFFAFWADGDPTKLTPSRLYFCNRAGDRVWQLPYELNGESARPIAISK